MGAGQGAPGDSLPSGDSYVSKGWFLFLLLQGSNDSEEEKQDEIVEDHDGGLVSL